METKVKDRIGNRGKVKPGPGICEYCWNTKGTITKERESLIDGAMLFLKFDKTIEYPKSWYLSGLWLKTKDIV